MSQRIFSHVCGFPCHTLWSIHLPESFFSSSPCFLMNTGSDVPISLPAYMRDEQMSLSEGLSLLTVFG